MRNYIVDFEKRDPALFNQIRLHTFCLKSLLQSFIVVQCNNQWRIRSEIENLEPHEWQFFKNLGCLILIFRHFLFKIVFESTILTRLGPSGAQKNIRKSDKATILAVDALIWPQPCCRIRLTQFPKWLLNNDGSFTMSTWDLRNGMEPFFLKTNLSAIYYFQPVFLVNNLGRKRYLETICLTSAVL